MSAIKLVLKELVTPKVFRKSLEINKATFMRSGGPKGWEIHRKLNFLLSTLAVLTAVTLLVFYLTTAEASRRETSRITRDIGFNLRIIPNATDMDYFWAVGFSDKTMPEDAVERFSEYKDVFLAYNQLVASLQQRTMLLGREVILVGLAPTIAAPAQRNRPMGFTIRPGTVHVGYQVAARLGLRKGDSLELGSEKFTVERCLSESGTDDDIRIFGALSDIQRVSNLPGRINEKRKTKSRRSIASA